MRKAYKFWYFRPEKSIVELIKGKWLSRTDKLVSARENYFFGNLPKKLPKNILLLEEVYIDEPRMKEYRYIIPKSELWKEVSYLHKLGDIVVRKQKIKVKNKPFNIDLVYEALPHFLGKHDFSNFTINREIKNPYCTIYKADLIERENYLIFILAGNRFLYHMVRKIVSFLISVGYGIFPIEFVDRVFEYPLNPKPKDASPQYLWLWKFYF